MSTFFRRSIFLFYHLPFTNSNKNSNKIDIEKSLSDLKNVNFCVKAKFVEASPLSLNLQKSFCLLRRIALKEASAKPINLAYSFQLWERNIWKIDCLCCFLLLYLNESQQEKQYFCFPSIEWNNVWKLIHKP